MDFCICTVQWGRESADFVFREVLPKDSTNLLELHNLQGLISHKISQSNQNLRVDTPEESYQISADLKYAKKSIIKSPVGIFLKILFFNTNTF